jgi:carbon-monoxide dehydrogenase large subunit
MMVGRAPDIPASPQPLIPNGFVVHGTGCDLNTLGIKGCGEAGISGALPTIMNAIVDALESNGIDGKNLNMPVTSEKMWEIIS